MEYLKTINVVDIYISDSKEFVGIKSYGNKIQFHIPTYFTLSENNLSEDIRLVLNTILKYSEQCDSYMYDKYIVGDTAALNSYINIIKDFITNGIYINKEKVTKSNVKGRVNWKKTFETTPIISNGNIIYKNLISSCNQFEENILVKINKYCLQKSIDKIGFLFDIDLFITENCNVTREEINHYIYVLDKQLTCTNNELLFNKFKNCKNLLQGLDSSSSNNKFEFGIKKYENIFEKMIFDLFNNVNNIKHYFPTSCWVIDSHHHIDNSNLRPDSIMIMNNEAYVIDAKYYSPTKYDKLPKTSSIQKQITYSETLSNINNNVDFIFNVFILPNKGYSKKIQYIGYAKTNWKDNSCTSHLIHAITIDLNVLMDSFVNVKSIDLKKKFINVLKNKVN